MSAGMEDKSGNMDGWMGRVVVHLSQCASVTADRPARSHRRECSPALVRGVATAAGDVTASPARSGRRLAARSPVWSGVVPRNSRGGAEHDEAEAQMWRYR